MQENNDLILKVDKQGFVMIQEALSRTFVHKDVCELIDSLSLQYFDQLPQRENEIRIKQGD